MPLTIRIHDEVEELLGDLLAQESGPLEPVDPFCLDHDCLNPIGHEFTASCGEVVCLHCARIAWR